MTADDEAYRRGVLARSRNFLLAEALRDEGWVLWLDVDIVQVRPPCSLNDQAVQLRRSTELVSPGVPFVGRRTGAVRAACQQPTQCHQCSCCAARVPSLRCITYLGLPHSGTVLHSCTPGHRQHCQAPAARSP